MHPIGFFAASCQGERRERPMSISVTLEASSSQRLVLSHYAPGEECRPHRHREAQLSLLLAGDYEEDSERGCARAGGPSLSRKPSGFEHQNRFGRAGALILALNVGAAPTLDRYFVGPRTGTFVCGESLRRLLEDGSGPADTEGEGPGLLTNRQPWLYRAHDRLLAEPRLGIGPLARSFGLHPVRFVHLFREAFAHSPSAVRQNHRAARAVGQLICSGTPLAEIAAAEGFADQAHLSRAVRQATGWSPGRLRGLFAGR
jgi:AraC family transcriptional regulator